MKEACCDWIGITDADGTYPDEKIPDFLTAMSEKDTVAVAIIGRSAKIPLVRKSAKWVLTKLHLFPLMG